MIVTKRQLRKLIREELLYEKAIASVSDLTRLSSVFNEWSDLLLDELTDKLPNGGAIKDLKLKYEGKDASEAEVFIQLYCSVFIPNENVDF